MYANCVPFQHLGWARPPAHVNVHPRRMSSLHPKLCFISQQRDNWLSPCRQWHQDSRAHANCGATTSHLTMASQQELQHLTRRNCRNIFCRLFARTRSIQQQKQLCTGCRTAPTDLHTPRPSRGGECLFSALNGQGHDWKKIRQSLQ